MANLTSEEKAAYDALTKAIDDVVEAQKLRSDGMVNVNYMVIVEQAGWDGDGDHRTGVVRIPKDDDLPWVSMLGLLRAATLLTERDYCTDGESM